MTSPLPVEPEGVATFCAASATRWAGLATGLLPDDSARHINIWISELWALADDFEPARAASLLARIDENPLANADDSHRAEYYPMRLVGVIAYGARANLQAAAEASALALSNARDLDFEVGVEPGQTLHSMEAAAQTTDADAISRGQRPAAIREAAIRSNVAKHLPSIVGNLRIARGWTHDIKRR